MRAPSQTTEFSLQLSRTFDAPRERVFSAWTEPDLIKQWFGPEGFTTPSAEVDLRVGGEIRVAMQPPEGEGHHFRGVFQEVAPPERLVYTFQWEKSDWDFPETLVTVEFHDRDGQTEVVLTHERFPDENMRDEHRGGWQGCLGSLQGYLDG